MWKNYKISSLAFVSDGIFCVRIDARFWKSSPCDVIKGTDPPARENGLVLSSAFSLIYCLSHRPKFQPEVKIFLKMAGNIRSRFPV